ncbi:MAG: polyprenyl synthetase family protein [Actinomycetes bacterium]
MSTPDSPLDIEDLRSRVSQALTDFLTRQRPKLCDISEELGVLDSALIDLLRGGKRLRPAFCWWGWRAAGGDHESSGALIAAASLELLQGSALVHDDVMDDSDTRRGMPAAHKRFSAIHLANGWGGDADRFGDAAAILLGDLCLSWTDDLFFSCGLPADAILRAKPVLDIMRTELLGGQYLDLLEQAKGSASPERALRVARYKSAKYTIERPLQLGATLANGSPELLGALSGYGLPIGEAFQIRDDVLGVFGDPEITGKPAGDDLREGKRTYLVAVALQSADQDQRQTLLEGLGNPELSQAAISAMREVIISTGALAQTEDLIARRTEQALRALDTVVLDPTVRNVLSDLAFIATSRSH